jgi:hypothetical protein
MSKVLVGSLQPGARPVGIGMKGARRGVALFGNVARAVIVNACPPPELAAECFCALLADALNVPAPPCGLVFENGAAHFASVDVRAPNLMQQFCLDMDHPREPELRALVAELAQWLGFGRLIALDVLVRNADRHPGNLLTDGEDFWAIDHGRTLGLYPYTTHKSYQLALAFADPLTCANIEASAVSNALTFPYGCAQGPRAELGDHAVIAGFAQPFAEQVANRLPTLASSIKLLL